jgi:thiol-disulfide isomerase/thioredoxin
LKQARGSAGSPPKVDIDVKSPADLKKLTDMMKKYKALVVFIYADWCGHCHSYRDQVWKNLPKAAAANNRGVGLVAINEQMLNKTPLAGVPVEGYPTNLVINTEGKPGVVKPVLFKDEEGNVSANIPNSRDMGTMTRLAQSTPEEILTNSAGVSENTVSPAASAAAKGFPLTENNYEKLNTAAGSSNSTAPFGNSATGSRNSTTLPVGNTRNSNANTIPVNSRVTAPASASLPNLNEPMNSMAATTESPGLSAAAAPPSAEEDLLLSQSKAPSAAASLRNSVQNLSAANKTLKGGGQVGGAALRFMKDYRGAFGGKKSARARRGRGHKGHRR